VRGRERDLGAAGRGLAADDGVDLSGILPVLEIEPSTTIFSLLSPPVPQAEVWTIRHFSRYILASG